MNHDKPTAARAISFVALFLVCVLALTSGLLVAVIALLCWMLGVFTAIAYHYEVGLIPYPKQKNEQQEGNIG